MKKKYLVSIICIFLCFLVVPGIASVAKGQSDFSEKENRALMTLPEFDFSSLFDGYFQSDYEEYIVDQFVFRDFFVSVKNKAFKLIGKTDINGEYIGKDGYILKKYVPADFNDDAIDEGVEYLTTYLNDMREKYANVYCVFVPSKSTVMANKLPAHTSAFCTDYVLDNVKESLNEEVKFLDLTKALSSHNDEYIYYKTDHHWTTLGAYYGYSEIKSKLFGKKVSPYSDYNPSIITDNFRGSDYDRLQLDSVEYDSITGISPKVKVKVSYNGDDDDRQSLFVKKYLNEKDKYAYFLGGNYRKINIKTDVDNGKKLLIVKDSFCNSMIPFLCEDYSEIVMIDLRYLEESIFENLKKEKGFTDIMVMFNTEKFMQDDNGWLLENDE